MGDADALLIAAAPSPSRFARHLSQRGEAKTQNPALKFLDPNLFTKRFGRAWDRVPHLFSLLVYFTSAVAVPPKMSVTVSSQRVQGRMADSLISGRVT